MWVLPIVIKDETSGVYAVRAVSLFWVVTGIHIILLGALIRNIYVSRHGGRLRKTRLFIPGVILILVSMFLFDEAGTCLEHQPDMLIHALVLFTDAMCDMISGIITIMLPTRLPDNQQENSI